MNNTGWKKFGIDAFIMFCVTMLVLSIFTFWIEPWVNEKPNMEMIANNPKHFKEGELVKFNITFENTGKATARELLIWAYEESASEEFQSEIAKEYPNILQSEDIAFAEFEMKAPENQQPYWKIKITITTTDGYSWKFDLMYDYQSDIQSYWIHHT